MLNKRVIITGVGAKLLQYRFLNIGSKVPSHTPIMAGDDEYKANIGAACALAYAQAGATVHLVARSTEKLEIVRHWLIEQVPGAQVELSPLDLANPVAVKQWAASLPDDKELSLIQSVGIGGGTVQLADDNPYKLLEDIDPALVAAELSVVQMTITLLQALLPQFRTQNETKVAVVTSMSAIRSFWSGAIHSAAKGALSRFVNAAMLEVAPEGIYLTDIRPGGVDTGLYDSLAVRQRVAEIAKTYGYDWSDAAGGLRLMPPTAVGEMVRLVLESPAHIPSVNLVAKGQWPHEGS